MNLPTEQEINDLMEKAKGRKGSTYIKIPIPPSDINIAGVALLRCFDNEKIETK